MREKAISWALREATAPDQRWLPRMRGRPGPERPQSPPDCDAYSVDILDGIGEIDAASWDAVVGETAITHTHAYFSAVEAAALAGCRYHYVVVRAAERGIVAHACIYLIDTDFAQLLPGWLRPLCRVLRRLWPRLLTARITECATPLATGSPVSVRSGADRRAVIALVERAMCTLARREGSRLLVMRDFFAAELKACDFLHQRGYKCVHNLPLARIRVRWSSYAEYLAAMRSRYRKDVRRRLRLAERAGRRVVRLGEFAAQAELWSAQAAAVCARTSSFKRESLNPGYYVAMNDKLGSDSQLLVLEDHGRYVAHGMLICDAESTTATYFGRDPGPPGGEWFQLMNEAIRVGIARRSRWINLGLGSYDAKTLVGADIESLYVYTRCTVPWLNALIKLVPDLMRRDRLRARHIFTDG